MEEVVLFFSSSPEKERKDCIMYRVYPRNCKSVVLLSRKIKRMEMDLRVRSLSPRAKEKLEKHVELLRLSLR